MKPNHISLYSLQVENGTPLKSKINSGAYEKPDDDKAAEMYEKAEKSLIKNFFQYEISNWSKNHLNVYIIKYTGKIIFI